MNNLGSAPAVHPLVPSIEVPVSISFLVCKLREGSPQHEPAIAELWESWLELTHPAELY